MPPPARKPPSVLRPLARTAFRALFVARSVNELGLWLGEVALAILVLDQTGSALATAAFFVGAQVVPAALAPIAVARLDRVDPRVLLPLVYVAEAACLAGLAAAAPSFLVPAVAVLTVLDGTLALSARTLTRATAAIVLRPHGELRAGNALLNVSVTAAAAVGPAVAGLVVAGIGVSGALLLGAGALLMTAATLALGRSLPASLGEPAAGEATAWRTRLREGLAYVRRRAGMPVLIAGQTLACIFFAVAIPIEVVYAKQTLDAGDSGYGALLASWGAGTVLGSLLFAGAVRLRLRWLLLVSTVAIGGAYLGLAAAPTLLVACLASVVGGAGNGVQWVALMNTVQELTADRYQARVVGLLESLVAAMLGIGFLLGGLVAELASPRTSYLVAGAGVLLVAVMAVPLLRGFRWPDEHPRQPEPGPPGVPSEPVPVRTPVR